MGPTNKRGGECVDTRTQTRLLNVMCAQLFSHVRFFATSWTVARQALLSVEFFRQEYYSGLPCLPPGDLPPSAPTQGSNLRLLLSCIGRQVLYHQLHPGSPWFPQWSPKLSTEIKTLNVRALSFSFIERRRTINQETASWRALRNCPKEVSGEVSVYVILAKGVHISRHTSQQKVAASHEDQISSLMVLVLVQLWKDARIQVHRKFS